MPRVMIHTAFALLLAATGLALVPAPADAAQGCKVVITASGKLRLQISTSPQGVVSITWGGMTGPRFRVRTSRGGDRRLCERNALDSDPTVTTNKADAQLFHVLNEAVRDARLEAGGDHATSYRDFRRMAGAIRNDILNKAIRDIVIDISVKVFNKVFPPLAAFEHMRVARYAVNRAIDLLIDGHLKGKDLNEIARNQAITIARDAATALGTEIDPEFEDALKRALGLAADGIKEAIKDKPQDQSGNASFENDTCKWFMNAFWSPTTEDYTIQFTKECGDTSAVSRVTMSSTAGKPGEAKTITIGALDILGLPVQVTAVTVRGLNAVMEPGANYAVAGLPGVAPTVTFTIAKPRKDTSYSIDATVSATNRGVTSTGIARGNVRVLNVAPRITGLPDGADADPGDNMTLSGKVTVVDDNADVNNGGEVRAGSLRVTGHPAALKTQFRLNQAARFSRDSFDGTTGTYVFDLTANAGNVDKPHEHKDDLTTGVRVEDDNRAVAEDPDGIELEVNDVLPKITLRVDPTRNYHRNDGVQVALSGRITDDNGADDIESAELDATAAGGAVWDLPAIEKARDEEGIDFEAPKFDHVNTEGDWPIKMKASDGDPAPNEAKKDDSIHVGNFGPDITGVGYVYEGGIGTQSHKVCPGQIFTAGAIVGDPENDALLVKATIKETGATTILVHQAGTKNYIGTMTAPGVPGEYTIEYTAVEQPSPLIAVPLTAVPMVTKLTVEPCDNLKVDDYTLEVRVHPMAVCQGEAFQVEAVADIFYTDRTHARVHPNGTVTYFAARASVGQAQPIAQFNAIAPPFGVQAIDLVLDVAGLSVTYQASVAVIPCGAFIDLVGFAGWAADLSARHTVEQNREEADLWSSACQAAMETLPGFVAPPGRDAGAAIQHSIAMAGRAAARAAVQEGEVGAVVEKYDAEKSVEAELLAKGARHGAATKAEKARSLVAGMRAALGAVANYRGLEQVFRAHAVLAGQRAQGTAPPPEAGTAQPNPRYCPDRIAFAINRLRPPATAQGDGSAAAANALILFGVMGGLATQDQHYGEEQEYHHQQWND